MKSHLQKYRTALSEHSQKRRKGGRGAKPSPAAAGAAAAGAAGSPGGSPRSKPARQGFSGPPEGVRSASLDDTLGLCDPDSDDEMCGSGAGAEDHPQSHAELLQTALKVRAPSGRIARRRAAAPTHLLNT